MKPFKIINDKSLDIAEKILKKSKYNTWIMRPQEKGLFYILQYQTGRKSFSSVIKIFIPDNKIDAYSDRFEEIGRKHFCENLW